MKPAQLILLLVILVLGIANLLAAFGVIGVIGGGSEKEGSWEYRVIAPAEMDSIGFKEIAEEEGIKPDEENKMKLPGERAKSDALLQTTLKTLAKDGWEPVSVSLNGLYIFRR